MQQLTIAQLVLDFSLYPRHHVDPTHVNALAEALRAGDTLPPILVEKGSMRVVDGFHRVHAHRKVLGANGTIAAQVKAYASEAEALADAIRTNAAHGRNLSSWDRARCIVLADAAGLERDRIAELLHVTADRLERFAPLHLAEYRGEHVPIKHTLSHLAGAELTTDQVAANGQAGGMAPLFYVNQLVLLLRKGAVDWSDERLVERMRELGRLLDAEMAVRG